MDKSPLARLPAEIRNRIYEYTFAGQVVYVQKFNSDHTTALTRTCRQIRKDTLLMVFAHASLALAYPSLWLSADTAPPEPINTKLGRVFGQAALALLKDKDILLDEASEEVIADYRRIRLSCGGCLTSGLSNGLPLIERAQRERERDIEWTSDVELGVSTGNGPWRHANHTCWRS